MTELEVFVLVSAEERALSLTLGSPYSGGSRGEMLLNSGLNYLWEKGPRQLCDFLLTRESLGPLRCARFAPLPSGSL